MPDLETFCGLVAGSAARAEPETSVPMKAATRPAARSGGRAVMDLLLVTPSTRRRWGAHSSAGEIDAPEPCARPVRLRDVVESFRRAVRNRPRFRGRASPRARGRQRDSSGASRPNMGRCRRTRDPRRARRAQGGAALLRLLLLPSLELLHLAAAARRDGSRGRRPEATLAVHGHVPRHARGGARLLGARGAPATASIHSALVPVLPRPPHRA